MNSNSLQHAYLDQAQVQLDKAFRVIDHCVRQLSTDQLWWRPTDGQNSIGNLMLHLCGNVRQWIIAGVGDQPDRRDRPAEFSERGPLPANDLLARLEAVLSETRSVLQSAAGQDLLALRRIQGFETTALAAIFDSVAHFKGHTQEIVSLTRMQLGDGYQFEWRPASAEEGA